MQNSRQLGKSNQHYSKYQRAGKRKLAAIISCIFHIQIPNIEKYEEIEKLSSHYGRQKL